MSDDFLCVRSKTSLKCLHRIAEDVAHPNIVVGCQVLHLRGPYQRYSTCSHHPSELSRVACAILVVLVVEASTRCIGIHNAHFYLMASP